MNCFFFSLLITMLSPLISVLAQSNFTKLIWQDAFDKEGKVDFAKWTYNTAMGCPVCGWGNDEKQYYTSRIKNVEIENGMLKIRVFREIYNGAGFTSGRIHTKNKFSVRYGRIEARAKVPVGYGTRPAIWMLGSNISQAGLPACGEIDIMEYKGSIPKRIYATLHYPGYLADNANGNKILMDNATGEFNLYAVEWTKEKIRILVNEIVINEVRNNSNIPYNHDYFILLNLAIGGGFAGPVDPALSEASFEIDYVRVYEQPT